MLGTKKRPDILAFDSYCANTCRHIVPAQVVRLVLSICIHHAILRGLFSLRSRTFLTPVTSFENPVKQEPWLQLGSHAGSTSLHPITLSVVVGGDSSIDTQLIKLSPLTTFLLLFKSLPLCMRTKLRWLPKHHHGSYYRRNLSRHGGKSIPTRRYPHCCPQV